MEELVRMVAEKAGISGESAESAVQTVVEFLQEKLPGPIADQTESALESGQGADIAEQAMGALGGLFGRD